MRNQANVSVALATSWAIAPRSRWAPRSIELRSVVLLSPFVVSAETLYELLFVPFGNLLLASSLLSYWGITGLSVKVFRPDNLNAFEGDGQQSLLNTPSKLVNILHLLHNSFW